MIKPTTKFAKKSLGQNFLIDQNYIEKIILALDPQPLQTVYEIGPGRGALTKHLLESGATVVAIEIDRDLITPLQTEFGGNQNFQLIEADFLQLDLAKLFKPTTFTQNKIVANLPYYISTAILQRLMEHRNSFNQLVLMLQREVVDRITAPPGDSARGFLTVLIEAFCEIQKLFDVPPTAFRPVPKVWSSVVSLKIKPGQNIVEDRLLKEILSLGFTQKRKTIFNNLRKNFPGVLKILENCRIEPQRRAETLTLDEWFCLISRLK